MLNNPKLRSASESTMRVNEWAQDKIMFSKQPIGFWLWVVLYASYAIGHQIGGANNNSTVSGNSRVNCFIWRKWIKPCGLCFFELYAQLGVKYPAGFYRKIQTENTLILMVDISETFSITAGQVYMFLRLTTVCVWIKSFGVNLHYFSLYNRE